MRSSLGPTIKPRFPQNRSITPGRSATIHNNHQGEMTFKEPEVKIIEPLAFGTSNVRNANFGINKKMSI